MVTLYNLIWHIWYISAIAQIRLIDQDLYMDPTIDGQTLPCFHLRVFVVTVGTDHPWTTVPWRTPHVWSVERLGSPGVLGLERSERSNNGWLFFIPYHPWGWYIYLHEWLIFVANVGKYIIHGCYGYCPYRPTFWTLKKTTTSALYCRFIMIQQSQWTSVCWQLAVLTEKILYPFEPTSKRIVSYQLFRCYVTTSFHVYRYMLPYIFCWVVPKLRVVQPTPQILRSGF